MNLRANELDRFYEYGPGQSALHAYARFSYDNDSRIDWRYRLSQNLPGNLAAQYTYDSRRRPTGQRIRDLAGVLPDRVTAYTYKAGNDTPLPDSVTSPNTGRVMQRGFIGLGFGGLGNSLRNNPYNTSALNGAFGPDPIGQGLQTAVTAFDIGGLVGRGIRSFPSAARGTANYFNKVQQTFRTPSFSMPSFNSGRGRK